MPPKIKFIGRYGNALVALLFGLAALMGLSRGNLGFMLFSAAVAGLGGFNIYVFEKVDGFFSEEEMLKAELRKAELRKELAGYGKFAEEPNAQAPGRKQASTAAPLHWANAGSATSAPKVTSQTRNIPTS